MIHDGEKIKEFCQGILGKNYDDVEVLCERAGFRLRTTKIDGQALMRTNDFRGDRINVHLRDGKVERAYCG